MLENWQVIGSTTTYEDAWLKVQSDRCLTRSGKLIEPYHVLQYPSWVNVVALTSNAEILLIRQYRHGVAKILMELPSGAVERSDQNPEAAIRREVMEETGFSGGEFFQLGCTYANPANQNNLVWSFLAVGVQPTHELKLDFNEEIEVVREDFKEFLKLVWQGNIQLQGLHVAALHFAVSFILQNQMPILGKLRQGLTDQLFSSS
ncbi:NUDIX hydrolase [Hassallia byssoidea VB512170]|uniref:NUDIX hydrolase n=1 Tax=Hassallia byssoidea VB512170 TaxID=1304833 RepID=A0A846H4P6_9CYAN|nr:NUDIX hydrolase [Hassalia byssoidea]NEU72195.1 NUDIX hydrolase [Hassalia byssoidea VB512170]